MKKKQIFLLHYAGGNCYSFDFIKSGLQAFEVVTLELPGRGKRSKEKLLSDFDAAAEDLFGQLSRKLTTSPYLIYGHSLGAYLGLRVTNLLEKHGSSPACLVVSGNPGPGIREAGRTKKKYELVGEEFIAELKKSGGVPEELLGNREFFSYYEPIIKADLQMSENKDLVNEPAVRSPLFAMMGSKENQVDKITNWGKYTQSGFSFEVMEGNHFFIYNHAARITAILNHAAAPRMLPC